MKSLLGKFIKVNFVNGDYESTWIRRINRQSKCFYISDVQRDVKSWNNDKDSEQMIQVGRWSKKFRKVKNGFKRVVTHLDNTDGTANLELINNLSTLRCEYTYDELFKTDIRKIQAIKEYPREQLEVKEKMDKKNNVHQEIPDYYVLDRYIDLKSAEDTSAFGGWDNPIIKYLQKQFGVPVYSLGWLKVIEYIKLSKLQKSGTFMHLTHFGGDKPIINRKQNYHNRTILFWLFEDRLVFQYADGMGTH